MTTSDPLLTPAGPVDVLVIARADLTAAVDEAVTRGHITAADAAALVQALTARGIPAPSDAAPVLAIRSRPPIPGYDELTSGEVAERLAGLAPPELRELRDYERRNANRKSVLDAVATRLG